MFSIRLLLLCFFAFNSHVIGGGMTLREAFSFDGERKGFIAGAGFGVGITYYASENDTISGDGTRIGQALDVFLVGIAPTNHFQIYYAWKSSVFYPELFDNYRDYLNKINFKTEEGSLWLVLTPIALPLITIFSDQHVLFDLGASYYLNREAPSYFFDIGFGPSFSSFPYDENDMPKPPDKMPAAYGFSIGAGYEFVSHWNAKCDIIWGRSTKTKSGLNNKYEALSLRLTLNFLAY